METEQELNKKLAEWVGFFRVTPKMLVGKSLRELQEQYWHYPDGQPCHYLPDFTQSLNSCFKWLVPKLFELGYWVKTNHHHSMYERNESHSVEIGQHKYTGGGMFVNAETPALALCRAISKLIGDKDV